MDASDTRQQIRLTPQFLLGLLIIAVGVLFTLDNLGLADARAYLRYWPAGLIAIGVLKLSQSRQSGGGLQGMLFVIAGTWLLLESLAIVHVSFWQLWPLLLVLFGASMVLRGLRGRPAASASDGNSTVSALAILSGVSRGNNSRSFKGGDLTSVMGGCDIDLRQATIEGEAVLDVFAMWGGIEIRVPEDWTVVSRVTPLLGGFEDQTRPSQTATPRRLIVRGMVVMGGVEVKN